MKKLLVIIMVLFFSCGNSFSQRLSGGTWASTKANKTGEITVTYTHAPKFSEVNYGQRKGLCFDIMYEFVSYVNSKYGVNLNINYKNLADDKDFDLFLKTLMVSNGGVFGLGNITITEARKKDYNFSPPYFSNVAILITNNSVPELSSMDNISKEFVGKTIIVEYGTTHEARANLLKTRFPQLVVETTKGFEEANKRVTENANYFTYIDFSTYLDILTQRMPLKRHKVGDQKGEEFGFIMPKDSDWTPVFSEFMAADGGFTKSVTYRKILAENLGSHVLKLMDAITK